MVSIDRSRFKLFPLRFKKKSVQTPHCKNFDKKFLDIFESFLLDAGKAHCSQGELVCTAQKGFFLFPSCNFPPTVLSRKFRGRFLANPTISWINSRLGKWNIQRLEFQRITAQQTQGSPEVELRFRSLAHTIHHICDWVA